MNKETIELIFRLVEIVIAPLLVYGVRKLDKLSDAVIEVNKELYGLRVLLTGVDGNNGIQSRVKGLEERERERDKII